MVKALGSWWSLVTTLACQAGEQIGFSLADWLAVGGLGS
jgi:hypothetical protein